MATHGKRGCNGYVVDAQGLQLCDSELKYARALPWGVKEYIGPLYLSRYTEAMKYRLYHHQLIKIASY